MIAAVHTVLYAHDADAARAFFSDVLGMASVDAGAVSWPDAVPATTPAIAAAPAPGPAGSVGCLSRRALPSLRCARLSPRARGRR